MIQSFIQEILNNPSELAKEKLLELGEEFSKVAGYKIHI